MRRARLVFVSLLALGAAFAAPAVGSLDDGTLTVQGATGTVTVNATGVIIGRMNGITRVQISDPDPTDGSLLQLPRCPDRQNISGRTADPDDRVIVCTGEDIRFRSVGGAFRVTVTAQRGSGINLSVAGKGRAVLAGLVTGEVAGEQITTGVYTVNDSDPAPMPVHYAFTLDANATTQQTP